jgi:hypothetical protein
MRRKVGRAIKPIPKILNIKIFCSVTIPKGSEITAYSSNCSTVFLGIVGKAGWMTNRYAIPQTKYQI